MKDFGYDHSCGVMSNATFMHTGYSGTCMCADPHNKLWSVILTNRLMLIYVYCMVIVVGCIIAKGSYVRAVAVTQ